jgi:hypothetical protein
MPDDGNDALFTVANLGFGVEAHPEGTKADTAAEGRTIRLPNQRKRKDALTLSHMIQSRKKN